MIATSQSSPYHIDQIIKLDQICRVEGAIVCRYIVSSIAFTSAPGILPWLCPPAGSPTALAFRDKMLHSQKDITLCDFFIVPLNDIRKGSKAVIGQPFVRNRVENIL